jgi:hypothetical protein
MKQLYRIHNNLFSSIKNLNYTKIDRFDISNKNKLINKKVLFNNIEKMSIFINESIYKNLNIPKNDSNNSTNNISNNSTNNISNNSTNNISNNITNDFDTELGIDFPSSRFY